MSILEFWPPQCAMAPETAIEETDWTAKMEDAAEIMSQSVGASREMKKHKE